MTAPPPAPRASFAESLAGADSAADEERRRGLRRMKVVALGFLVGATIIFLFCTWAQSHGAPGWVGYIRAASYGHTLGGAVGLAMIDAGDVPLDQAWIDAGRWTVEIAERLYPATASLRPLYDPKNERIKM